MGVVGFDFGDENSVVAVARLGRIDVALNQELKPKTPAVVYFRGQRRLIGTTGAYLASENPHNSVSHLKRLIGRPFSDPELQYHLKEMPFAVTEGPDGFPLIHTRYLGEETTFTPTEVLGMIFSDLKGIAEKNLNASVKHCCIGIPIYFNSLQRRAVLDAATIAGLHPLRLVNETTATALAYGIQNKVALPENDQRNIAFVDIGHTSMQVCLAGFKAGQLNVLSHSFDRCLGGQDFDEVLFQHFAAKMKDESKIDVFKSARACTRLSEACEELKRKLSLYTEASLYIHHLINETDGKGFIRRDEFEQISMPIFERLKITLDKALADAGLLVENIHAVEVVGSGSRIPAITRIMTEYFGKSPSQTMIDSESVASGCALQGSILMQMCEDNDFQVNESLPFPISLSWKGSDPGSKNGGSESQENIIIFPKGSPIPSVKAVNIYASGTFTINVQYSVDGSELQAPAKISTYTIGPFESITGEWSKLEVKVHLNLHRIVSVESATLLEEEDADDSVGKEPLKGATAMETEENSEADVSMQDATGATDSKGEAPEKMVKKTSLPVSGTVCGALSSGYLMKAVEKEAEMGLQDQLLEAKDYKLDALAGIAYRLKMKFEGELKEFVTHAEKGEFRTKLEKMEDWLFDGRLDEMMDVHISELMELKKQGKRIEERYREHVEREAAIDQLTICINGYREVISSDGPELDHIDLCEKEKVLEECKQAEDWLRDEQRKQGALAKWETPVLLSTVVKSKTIALDRVCGEIVAKHKPHLTIEAPSMDDALDNLQQRP